MDRVATTARQPSTPSEGEARSAIARDEHVFVRNYDPYRGYDCSITVRAPDGSIAFEDSYSLRPGQIECVQGVLEPGRYAVTVGLDRYREKTVACRVGPSPAETIHVEIGNGILSVTEGLFG